MMAAPDTGGMQAPGLPSSVTASRGLDKSVEMPRQAATAFVNSMNRGLETCPEATRGDGPSFMPNSFHLTAPTLARQGQVTIGDKHAATTIPHSMGEPYRPFQYPQNGSQEQPSGHRHHHHHQTHISSHRHHYHHHRASHPHRHHHHHHYHGLGKHPEQPPLHHCMSDLFGQAESPCPPADVGVVGSHPLVPPGGPSDSASVPTLPSDGGSEYGISAARRASGPNRPAIGEPGPERESSGERPLSLPIAKRPVCGAVNPPLSEGQQQQRQQQQQQQEQTRPLPAHQQQRQCQRPELQPQQLQQQQPQPHSQQQHQEQQQQQSQAQQEERQLLRQSQQAKAHGSQLSRRGSSVSRLLLGRGGQVDAAAQRRPRPRPSLRSECPFDWGLELPADELFPGVAGPPEGNGWPALEQRMAQLNKEAWSSSSTRKIFMSSVELWDRIARTVRARRAAEEADAAAGKAPTQPGSGSGSHSGAPLTSGPLRELPNGPRHPQTEPACSADNGEGGDDSVWGGLSPDVARSCCTGDAPPPPMQSGQPQQQQQPQAWAGHRVGAQQQQQTYVQKGLPPSYPDQTPPENGAMSSRAGKPEDSPEPPPAATLSPLRPPPQLDSLPGSDPQQQLTPQYPQHHLSPSPLQQRLQAAADPPQHPHDSRAPAQCVAPGPDPCMAPAPAPPMSFAPSIAPVPPKASAPPMPSALAVVPAPSVAQAMAPAPPMAPFRASSPAPLMAPFRASSPAPPMAPNPSSPLAPNPAPAPAPAPLMAPGQPMAPAPAPPMAPGPAPASAPFTVRAPDPASCMAPGPPAACMAPGPSMAPVRRPPKPPGPASFNQPGPVPGDGGVPAGGLYAALLREWRASIQSLDCAASTGGSVGAGGVQGSLIATVARLAAGVTGPGGRVSSSNAGDSGGCVGIAGGSHGWGSGSAGGAAGVGLEGFSRRVSVSGPGAGWGVVGLKRPRDAGSPLPEAAMQRWEHLLAKMEMQLRLRPHVL